MPRTFALPSTVTLALLVLVGGCSREQRDWRSAQAADTIEAYTLFVQRHPDSEHAAQARARLAQLGEERDWIRASERNTVEAYRSFLRQHPDGRWAQEARIRLESHQLAENERSLSPAPAAASQRGEPAASYYGIQLGAFSSEPNARREWERLSGRFPAQLGSLTPRIVEARTASGRVFRLQADVADESRARALCSALKSQSQGCVVVLPGER
ncbi:MAG: SPOR domain-containing protein [Pseudomonadota bacterium]|jgi:Sporulation related domain.|nr:MAG: hypothetical protein DIU56_11375 [Pseudomonadota bacterium]